MQPKKGAAIYTVTIDPILLETPDERIGWRADARGDIHYLGPVTPREPQPIETGNYSQE
jgi:hypothetical protein